MATSQYTDAEGRTITSRSGTFRPGGLLSPLIAYAGLACVFFGAFPAITSAEPLRALPLGLIGLALILSAIFNAVSDVRR